MQEVTGEEKGKPVKPAVYGNPEYTSKDDIYSHESKVPFNENEEDEQLDSSEMEGEDNGLDVPGSELDNLDEEIGEEDEENNYYSLGGDNHNDLEEGEDGE